MARGVKDPRGEPPMSKIPPKQIDGLSVIRTVDDIAKAARAISLAAPDQALWIQQPGFSAPDVRITDLDLVNLGIVNSWILMVAGGGAEVGQAGCPLVDVLEATASVLAQHPARLCLMDYWGQVYTPPAEGYPAGTPSRRGFYLDRVRKLGRAGFIHLEQPLGTRIDPETNLPKSAMRYLACPTQIGVIRAEWAANRSRTGSVISLAEGAVKKI